jgi:predicted transcriptional regulator
MKKLLNKKSIKVFSEESLKIAKEVRSMPRKVQVTFSNGQWKLIEKLRGTIGDTDSEIVRNIVISYLSEKSYIKEEATNKNKKISASV